MLKDSPSARQDFLVISPTLATAGLAKDLQWMTNVELGDNSNWCYVPTKKLVRAFVPLQLALEGVCFAWQISGPDMPLVKSAVSEGTWISLANIKQLCNHLKVPPPNKAGNKLKADWAQVLVNHFFPEGTVSEEERQRMIAGLTWRRQFDQLGDKEKEILQMVSELDEENRSAPEFQRVIKLAKNQLRQTEAEEVATKTRRAAEQEFQEVREKEKKKHQSEIEERVKAAVAQATAAAEAEAKQKAEQKEKDQQEASSGSRTRKQAENPPNLKDFLTEEMKNKKVSITRDSSGYGYRAYYPSSFSFAESHVFLPAIYFPARFWVNWL